MNFKKLMFSYFAFSKIAGTLIKDKGKTLSKIREGFAKANENKGALANVWEQLQLLFSLAKDYTSGAYTAIPKTTMISVLAALLYFISPLDLVPDFLVGLGFLDDAVILGFVFKKVTKELEKYQAWKSLSTSKEDSNKIIHI